MAGYGFWTGGGGSTGGLITGNVPINGNGELVIQQGDASFPVQLAQVGGEGGVNQVNFNGQNVLAYRVSVNGGPLPLPNILQSMRVNASGGIFRMYRPDGVGVAADPFYIGSTLDAAAFYYTSLGVLSIGLASQTFSWFNNGITVGGINSPSLIAGVKLKVIGLQENVVTVDNTAKADSGTYMPIVINGVTKYFKIYS